MAIKGGQILHVAGGPAGLFVIDRIQTAGVTGINVNEDRLEELGNYQATGTVRDIPDLTFELESFDMTTELISLLTGGDNTETAGHLFDISQFIPLNILSPFKSSGAYAIQGSVLVPFLSLESLSYQFALTDSASLTATLRGDSVFYSKGGAYEQVESGNGSTTVFAFDNAPAYRSVISGDDYFALSVSVKEADGKWYRKRLGTDYTNDANGVTFVVAPPSGTGNIKIVYTSGTAQEFLQTVHDATKPAGVRGRNVHIRLGDGAATPSYTTWVGIQSANVDWRVTLERDEEFGNPQVVGQDFDTPECSGSITMKPSDVATLYNKIQEVAGITSTDVANATADPPELQLEVRIEDPDTGDTLSTLYVPDAKFTLPAIQGNVGQKLEQDFPWTSGSGVLSIYKGDPA